MTSFKLPHYDIREKVGDHIAWIGPLMLLLLIGVVAYNLS